MKTSLRCLIPSVALSLLAVHSQLQAQTAQATLTTLHSFFGPSGEGSNPTAALVEDGNGTFYGTTLNGGANSDGTVFSVTADKDFANLYSFQTVATDGETPAAPLSVGNNGNLYGTTQGTAANRGTVFEITTAGNLNTLYDFQSITTDGAHPEAPLIEDADGNLYGTTSSGGSSDNLGTFFEITSSGKEMVLHAFGGNPDGADPIGPFVLGSDGNFYGTTFSGGANNAGTVYRMMPGGTVTILHNFTSNGAGGDGSAVRGGLVEGSDGAFYGTTESGGTNNEGTVFRITMAGDFKLLHSFSASNPNDGTNSDGVVPYAGLSVGSDGNLYGATGGGGSHAAGTLFRITPAGVLTSLYSFTPPGNGFVNDDGATPYAPPVEGSDGNFYGTTYVGGSSGKGVVYQMEVVPAITSPTTAGAYVGRAFSYQIEAAYKADRYGVQGLPAGLQINSQTGVISGTLTATGTHTLTLQAKNAVGIGEATLTLTVYTAAAPVVTSTGTVNAYEGNAFSYQIKASNGPTSYSVSGLPAGLQVDAATGLISGTPTVSGTKTLGITATNPYGSGQGTLTLDILGQPVITSAATATAQVDKAFSYQIKASNSPTSYGVGGLRPGLSVDAKTGLISGTPTGSGTFTLVLMATNAAGTGKLNLTLTIKPSVPVITSPGTASATVGKPFSYQIKATSSPTSYGVGGLFKGITVDQQTGLISGTPTSAGTHTLQLRAANGGGTGTKDLTLTTTN